MIKACHLRVYLPADRIRSLPSHEPPIAARIVRTSDRFLWEEPMAEDAFSVEWHGRAYVCPRSPRLRLLEGLLASRNANPGLPLLSDQERTRHQQELTRLKGEAPDVRSHILTSPWHVPLRWFAAFRSDEREVYESNEGLGIRYRTTLGEAVARVAEVVSVLDEAGFAEGVVEQVRELEQWLSEFAADSMLELDYAGVASLFSDGDLVLDESSDDVRKSIEALERGDYEEAGEFYMTVASRWAPAQAVTFSN